MQQSKDDMYDDHTTIKKARDDNDDDRYNTAIKHSKKGMMTMQQSTGKEINHDSNHAITNQ